MPDPAKKEQYEAQFVGKFYVHPEDPKENSGGKQSFGKGDLPSGTVRVLRPYDISTEDYKPDRLNINLDDNDVCKSIHFS